MDIQRIFHFILTLAARASVWPLTWLVARDNTLWAFGCGKGQRYADNAKWLYLHASTKPGTTAIWVTDSASVYRDLTSRGHPVVMKRSLRGLWAALRAGVYVYDSYPNDINFAASRGAKLVSLWHGIPLKRIERDISLPGHFFERGRSGTIFQRLSLWLRLPWMFRSPALVVSTSDAVSVLFRSAFGVGPNVVKVLGYPRNDPLLTRPLDDGNQFAAEVRGLQAGGTKVLLYMPTFRDSGRPFLPTPAEQVQLSNAMRELGAVLFLKLHPLDASRFALDASSEFIRLVDSRSDPYSALPFVDVLITDYSSIMFDYLLLDRPMVFYCPDLEDYLRSDRDMYFPYDEVTPGPKAMTVPELNEAIRAVLQGGTNEHAVQRAALRRRFHSFVDGNSAERTFEAIRGLTR